MDINLRPPVIAAQFQREARRDDALKAASDGLGYSAEACDPDEGYESSDSAEVLRQKLADMADDMANVAAQFRNRKEFERERAVLGGDFDRVLEDDGLADKVQELLAASAVPDGIVRDLLAQARMLFVDDSDLYIVLRELLKKKWLLQVQRTRLLMLAGAIERDTDPKLLKAGINCALKAKLFGATLALKAPLLRQTYRRFLDADDQPLEIYENWIACYGYRARHVVLDFVEESLSTDIRSEDPSCSHLEFSYLIGHMQKIRLLRTADRQFITALLSKKLLNAGADEEVEWLLLLCNFVRAEHEPGALVLNLLNVAGAELSLRQREVAFQSVRAAYKNLPDALFLKERDMMNVLASFDGLDAELGMISRDSFSGSSGQS